MNGNQMEEHKDTGSMKPQPKATPIQIAAITLSSVAIVAAGAIFLTRDKATPEPENPAVQKIGMEANIITDEADAAALETSEPFAFTTQHNRDIYITGGRNASCRIGNSSSNYYEDMYIQIYLNNENDEPLMDDPVYVSKIIPRGSHIESFEAQRDLEPGDYRGTLIYSAVNEAGELVGDLPVIVEIHVQE